MILTRVLLRGPRVLASCLVLCFTGCQSVPEVNPDHFQKCECGTEEVDTFGCTAGCSVGTSTCENPKCTCEHGNVVQPEVKR